MKVNLVTIAAEDSQTLEQMLLHYRNLGIDELLICVRGSDAADPWLQRSAEIAARVGARIIFRGVGHWELALNQVFYNSVRKRFPDEWFIIADPDEFHLYDKDLKDLLKYCDDRGYDHIEGAFVDRVAASGRIETFDETSDIWEQYPYGGMITGPICRATISKAVAVKGRVVLGPGQHTAGGRGCPISDIYVQVHHFKWMNDILERLRIRARGQVTGGSPYSQQCARFVEFYEATGAIPFDRAELAMRKSLPAYPDWNLFKSQRANAVQFTPWLTP